jgi:phosphoribosylformylglycinamidine synthase subunit PurQ / glutaminase
MPAPAPTALVITTAGINCDLELSRAFELAGASPRSLHLNELMRDPARLDDFDLIGLPGGFSYGDAVAAGRIAAQLMRQALYPAFVRAINRGTPIIAPCNGFQMAVQLGLLPGPDDHDAWPSDPPRQTIALANNESARFVDRWCRVTVPEQTRCIWTQGLQVDATASMLPIAHGEGRLIPESPALIDQLRQRGQIALQYDADDNPNGTSADIEGLCDSTGVVFGLMPHPERFTRWTQHPFWPRFDEKAMRGEPTGLRMFRNAVAHVMKTDANEPAPVITSRGSGSALAAR